MRVSDLPAHLRAVTTTGRRTWGAVFLGTLAVYLFTAHWQVGQVVDSLGGAWPGYALRVHGSLFLEGTGAEPSIAIGEANGHLVSLRTPGVILTGIPVQVLLGWLGLTAMQGGALTAAVLAAATMANLALLLRGLVAHALVLPITTVVAFGTSVWTVAAAELWTHGPDIFFLTSALLLLQRQRVLLGALALSAAVLTRPHLAAVPLALAASEVLATRTWRPLARFGFPAVGALAATVAWNAWYIGEARLLIGAYNGQSARVLGGSDADFSPSLLTNALGFLLSPGVGLLLFSPVALVSLWCLRPGWQRSPWWVRGGAVGGLLYALVQAKLNHFHGGGGFYGYRLLLEPLVLAVPLVALGYEEVRVRKAWLPALARLTAEASIGIYAMGALLGYYWHGGTKDWDAWYPWVVLRAAGTAALPVAVVVVSALLLGRALTQKPSAGLSWRTRPSSPLTNAGLSSVERLEARTTASLTATSSGTSSHQRSS